MKPRIRIFLVGLAVCLQLADAALTVCGHTHEHDTLASAPCCGQRHVHRGHEHSCGHHHRHHHNATTTKEPTPSPAPADVPHDDCALCRHASQPVALVAFVVEPVGAELVAPVVLTARTNPRARHLSRARSRAPPLGIA